MTTHSADDADNTVAGRWYGRGGYRLDIAVDDRRLTGVLYDGSHSHDAAGWSGQKGFVFTASLASDKFIAAAGRITFDPTAKLILTVMTVTSDDQYWASQHTEKVVLYRTVEEAERAAAQVKRQKEAADAAATPQPSESIGAVDTLSELALRVPPSDRASGYVRGAIREARLTPDRPPIKSPRDKE